ncbi:MAG: hypothetical protein NVSMB65_00290 [Chloroflexota bacterium]
MPRRRSSRSTPADRSAPPVASTSPAGQAPTVRTTWGEKARGLATTTDTERPRALLLGVYRPRFLEGRDERAAAVTPPPGTIVPASTNWSDWPTQRASWSPAA